MMLSENDLRFLKQRKRFHKYGPVIAGALVVIFALLLGYLLGREQVLTKQLFPFLFLISAILLIYCFYRGVDIERKDLEIIDKLIQS